MANKDHSLDPLIIKAAKDEFFEKGYIGASLRNIASKCNITTGALYTRYKNKEELFKSLITSAFMDLTKNEKLKEINELYLEAKKEKDVNKFLNAIKKEEKIYLDVLFDHYDECVLLICKSEGSKLNENLSKLIEFKNTQTIDFFKSISNKNIDFDSIALIMNEQFNYYRQILEKRYSKEKALSIMKIVDIFIEAGWKKIFEEII